MIYGIGCDIVDVRRVKKLYARFNKRFIQRILTENEIANFKNKYNLNSLKDIDLYDAYNTHDLHHVNTHNNGHYIHNIFILYIAKRFAAKEAYAKATGMGIGVGGFGFCDLEINNDEKGKPYFIKTCSKHDQKNIHLSMSDNGNYAIAYVIIEKL